MANLQRRFPEKQEVIQLFLVIVFPIHFWSIIGYCYVFPALMLRMTIGEMLGFLAYTQVSSLFESLLVLGCVLALAFILPENWLLCRFVERGTILVFVSLLWMAPVYYSSLLFYGLSISNLMKGIYWFILIILYALAIWDLAVVVRKYAKIANIIRNFIDKLAIVSSAYLIVDLLSVIIVVYRQLL